MVDKTLDLKKVAEKMKKKDVDLTKLYEQPKNDKK